MGLTETRTKDKFDTVFVIADRLSGYIQGDSLFEEKIECRKDSTHVPSSVCTVDGNTNGNFVR